MFVSSTTVPIFVSGRQAITLSNQKDVRFIDGSWYMDKSQAPESSSTKYIPGKFEYDVVKQNQWVFTFCSNKLYIGSRLINIDDVKDPVSNLPHMLPSSNIFDEFMSKIGIKNDDHLIIYVQPKCFSAARMFWFLKVFGHEKVSIIDGS